LLCCWRDIALTTLYNLCGTNQNQTFTTLIEPPHKIYKCLSHTHTSPTPSSSYMRPSHPTVNVNSMPLSHIPSFPNHYSACVPIIEGSVGDSLILTRETTERDESVSK
jgi:hypothetical protein